MEKQPKKLRRAIRKFERKRRGLDRLAACCPSGAQRPKCALDGAAEKLGIYDEGYHCLNRHERKRLVSVALRSQKA